MDTADSARELARSESIGVVQPFRQGRSLRRRKGADFDRQIVWVLGSPRSGSTWLLYLLGDHDRVVPVNEPLIGSYLGPFMCDLPGVHARDLGPEDFTVRRLQAGNPSQFFAEEFSDVWLPGLGTMLRERFRAHTQRYPPAAGAATALVLVKEPNGSQSADLLLRATPGSHSLFLLRDGRDVVDSELAGNSPGGWMTREFPSRGIAEDERLEFVTQSAMKWLWRTEVVEQAHRAHRGPKHLVRYEDLRADPVAHVRAILEWLGAPMADGDLTALVRRHEFEQVPDEKRGPEEFHRAAQPGKWRENLSAAEQTAIEAAIGPKLRELGYEA